MSEPTKEQIEKCVVWAELAEHDGDPETASAIRGLLSAYEEQAEAEIWRLLAKLELSQGETGSVDLYATQQRERAEKAEARLEKVVEQARKSPIVSYTPVDGEAIHVVPVSVILSAAQPEDPCSACGDGDTEQRFHKHAAQPEEDPLYGMLEETSRRVSEWPEWRRSEDSKREQARLTEEKSR